MAQPWCTGAAHLFVGNGSAATFYLGTCEDHPSIVNHVEHVPVMNDISGRNVPFDLSYQGQSAVISGTLTRFNEAGIQFLSNLPWPYGNRGFRGFTGPLEMGMLMALEGASFNTWIYWPYGVKAAMRPAGDTPMRTVRRYYQCITFDNYALGTGARPKEIDFTIFAWPLYATGAQSGLEKGGLYLFSEQDQDAVGLQALIN